MAGDPTIAAESVGAPPTPAPTPTEPESGRKNKPWVALLKAVVLNPAFWFMLAAAVLAVITVLVGTAEVPENGEPNRLATSLLQGITLFFGAIGSFIFGKDASRRAAETLVRSHAKSAFRRVMTLYEALGRLRATSVTEANFLREQEAGGTISLHLSIASLDKIRLMSTEQIATADDALEDWRDLAPDEVAKILEAARADGTGWQRLVEEEP